MPARPTAENTRRRDFPRMPSPGPAAAVLARQGSDNEPLPRHERGPRRRGGGRAPVCGTGADLLREGRPGVGCLRGGRQEELEAQIGSDWYEAHVPVADEVVKRYRHREGGTS